MNPALSDPAADRRALARAGDHRHPAFLRVARPYARHRVSRGLDGMWVAGLDEVRAALADRPVIFASNHVAWWDTLLLVVLGEALGGQCWAVMDAGNLRRLPFFGWLGALPLERDSPERSRESLVNAAALLDRPGRGVWIFPQGRQRPAHLRPLDLRGGIGIMHARSPVDVIVVSFDYIFLERHRPAAVVRFGPPMPGATVGGRALLPAVEGALLDGLAAIDVAAAAATDGRRARTHPQDPLPGFVPLVPPTGILRAVRRRRAHAG